MTKLLEKIFTGVACCLLAGEVGVASAAELEGAVGRSAIDMETLCAIGRARQCDIKLALRRGLVETGLWPSFPEGLQCRDIDSEKWAISYSSKRDREQYHGGIDMPAPFGTPIIAAADGVVVGIYEGLQNYRGVEVVLRHTPEDTGIPLWIYTQYTHFDAMPDLVVGQRVRMGDVLGPTGNSGIQGKGGGMKKKKKKERRPAIHFAVFYSDSPEFHDTGKGIIPKNGYWMDPNALYRKAPPFDSYILRDLPDGDKRVPIPVMVEGGQLVPPDTKLIWPYACTKK